MNLNNVEFTKKIYSEPTFIEDFSEHGQIITIEFSTYDWSQDVILIGFQNKILLAHLNFEDKIRVNILTEFKHPCRCTNLNLSPDTSLNVLPNMVTFCAAGSDFKLRIFQSDLMEDNMCKVLPGHTNYINDIKYDCDNTYLASVSDDNTVKVWLVEDYSLLCSFDLSSPGVMVGWNKTEGSKLMVAEKMGIIRLYNVETRIPFLSFDNGKPLASAHWSPGDNQLVASLQLGELFIWDLTKPCMPILNSRLFPENGGYIRFSTRGTHLVAVNNLHGTLKIIHVETQNSKLSASVTLPTNVCWHYRYPVICIGDDMKLCFWKVAA